VPAGKNPLATFLTQLGRSPVIKRATEPGVYQLDRDFPQHARVRLNQPRAELRRAHEAPVDADADTLAAARECRTALFTEVERLERDLEETLRSLGATNGNGRLAVIDAR
jgi:hypothetical protein